VLWIFKPYAGSAFAEYVFLNEGLSDYNMDHVAIMKRSWGLTEKLLSGKKEIESRWYMSKYPPWDRIKAGDTVYFKDSGEPVTVRSRVARVLQFSALTPNKVMDLLMSYGKEDGIEKGEIQKYFKVFNSKRYCILVFLKNIERVKPFRIDKSGFGAMAAWITLESIDKIRE